MVGTFKGHLVQLLYTDQRQLQLEQVLRAQSILTLSLSGDGGIHHLSGQPLLVLRCPCGEEKVQQTTMFISI